MQARTVLEALLRLVGVLWLVGGALTLREVWRWRFMDPALAALEAALASLPGQDAVADTGRNRWLLIGGVLTVASGAGLLVATPWALGPLTALVVHQILYARRQARRVSHASTPIGKDFAEISPPAQRAAWFSLGVWAVALVLWGP